jgi:hypothetical protein
MAYFRENFRKKPGKTRKTLSLPAGGPLLKKGIIKTPSAPLYKRGESKWNINPIAKHFPLY